MYLCVLGMAGRHTMEAFETEKSFNHVTLFCLCKNINSKNISQRAVIMVGTG